MAISETLRKVLFARANGQCECTMSDCKDHDAGKRCPNKLIAGKWEAHHKTSGGPDTLSNLIAMCSTCHENTRTYGRP
jgi:hypothetical protein